ncbi:uncharacterized protein LOC110453073 [Mizuhopecten yessoensis]|uniref:VWFA domain-containing protein n=1 Tax=Mizuhopecten yessoensis TaxID=6573 RepID=A0A210QI41_MIZYE|nr:uncharacterized protein LOC110453073 [Mizuhopecten yessoensis]OWF48410.1 hypothetical protein KP79_PYT14767 [Mizuhopecten yessoensis]
MISALFLLVVTISTIDGMPYSLDEEATRLLERRGKPVVCDAGKPGSIAFVFDTADGTNDFDDQKDYAAKIAKFLPENGKVSVAGLVYGGSTATTIPLGSETTYDRLVSAINGISEEEHGPRNEAAALTAAAGLLKDSSGEKAIVLFVDGSAADAAAAKAEVEKLEGNEITVFFAFPKSLYSSLETELKEIATEPYSLSLNAMNSLSLAESIGIEFDIKYSC